MPKFEIPISSQF